MASQKSYLSFDTDRNRQDAPLSSTPVPAGLSDGSGERSFRDFLDICFRRRRILLAALAAGTAVGAFLMLSPRQYTAEGAIRVQPGMSSMYRTSPMNVLAGEDSDKIASETSIVQSRTLYLQAAKELDLANDPAFQGKSKVGRVSLDDPVIREKLIRRMRKDISVTHNPKDEIISIRCTTLSPVLSARIVNTLIHDYIAYLFQMRFTSTQRASGWLIGQLSDLKQQIENDQTQITGLQKKLGVIGLNEQNAEYLQTQSLDSLTKAASAATIERIVAEARFRYLQESDPNLIEGEVNLMNQGPTNGQNSLLENLRNRQAQAASASARLLQQFGPNYPDVREEKAELDSLTAQVHLEEQRILNQARISYDAASAGERLTRGALARQTGEAFRSQGAMVQYVLLLHDYESHRTLYEGLVQRLREAGITSGLEAGEIDVVDLADLPALPNGPGPLLLLGGSIVASLIGGCTITLGVNALDTRVTTTEQAERAAELPLLGVVPHSGKVTGGGHGRLLSPFVATGTHYSEAVQSLRSSILLARAGLPPKVILVTSAAPGEGKSTTARNLAASFARHRARVVLIDCDLRKGSQADAFGMTAMNGVSHVLTRQTSLDDALHACPDLEALFVLPAGPHPPDPAVLMGSAEMAELVRACAERFDYVILDSAPVLGFADVIHAGQLVDAAVLVMREGYSSRNAVREASRRILRSGLPVAGFVLNDVDTRAHAYSYGYGYRGYYDDYYRKTAESSQ